MDEKEKLDEPGLHEPPAPKEKLKDKVESVDERVKALENAAAPAKPNPGSMTPMARMTRDRLNREPKVEIMIPATEKEKDPVVVGINGYVYRIKRNEWVKVPESVVGVLDNAILTVYTQKKGEERMELEESTAQRIPFQRKVG